MSWKAEFTTNRPPGKKTTPYWGRAVETPITSAALLTFEEAVIGGIHGDIEHYHCPRFMIWVFTQLPRDTPMKFVNVRATMLDDATWFGPFIESYTCEKLLWV